MINGDKKKNTVCNLSNTEREQLPCDPFRLFVIGRVENDQKYPFFYKRLVLSFTFSFNTTLDLRYELLLI